ncbi:condensin-2 complex subunit D3-like [Chenopodium quinoa]|uniref:condensin-2 complex subunit D3-like n=1 Tax=Chenopodium quinoa TaxID=63459 RepID=UPI000B78ACFD|nr:condensin-2 complex subunit D3-like [Chenopodium quinoa]
MEDTSISRILTDLESLDPQSPISRSTLLDLQSLLNLQSHNFDDDTPQINHLWDQLSTRRLSPCSLINPISSAMESSSSSLSLLASAVYLSLFLSPNAPVFSLFTPVSFMSLLYSIRRALKYRKEGSDEQQRKKGRGKRAKALNPNLNDADDNEFDIRLLLGVLDKLGLVLGLVHLGRFPDSLKSLVQTVVEIPVLGLDLCANNSGNCKKLLDFCSGILRQILKPEHGEQEMTAAEVLKSLAPLILSTKSQARTFALCFVRIEMMGMAKDSSSLNKAVGNLPRYLAQKAPEKSDARALAVESILDIVIAMESCDQVGFVDYVMKMAHGKSHLRHLAVELIPKLMMSLQVLEGSESDSEVEEDSWKSRCLVALVLRCSDTVAGIRARALSSLAQLVGNTSADNERDRVVLKKSLGFNDGVEGKANDFLKKRCTDEKAVVRKAALLLITKLMSLVGSSMDPDILKMMGIACSDPLVSIRKAAISALSEAFRIFSDRSVVIEWLHSVPRLIIDSETSIQEECESLFMELVLDRVSRAGSATFGDVPAVNKSTISSRCFEKELAAMYPEGVLDLLSEICNGEVTLWVKKICASLGKKGKLRPKIATALQNIIKTSESLWLSHSMPIDNWTAPPGAWLLLSEVSSFLRKSVDWEFLYHHWKLLDRDVTSDELKSHTLEDNMHDSADGMVTNSAVWACDRVLLLQTISNVSVELSPEPAAQLAHDLLKRIEEFNMHSTEVNAHVKALKTLCKRKAMSPQEADALVIKSVEQLFCKASHVVDMYLSEEQKASKENNLFTPSKSTKKGKRAAASSRLLLQATTAVYTIGSLVIICPSLDLKAIVPVLHSMITSGSHESRSNQLPGSTISIKEKAPCLYIQAWLTMGKICLADGKLAKRYIPLFVQELEKSDCAALRNNIVVIMADFCVRYTALVDCYIAKITKCLRDTCELVRRQTFILLSRLLQTDYVKWRGVLFLRFLLSLDDESDKIRQLADFLFGNILKAKAPLLAYNSFVEAVFVLNDCQAYVTNNKSQNSRVERRLFSIRGNDENTRSRRMHIYVSLLKQMAPEHLLATFAKICAEILAAASDGILSVDDVRGQSVLQDAFRILTCKELRLPSSCAATSEAEMDEEGGDGNAASTAAARGRAITQAVKKGLIQNTIPIFIELKRLLENKNSPLIGSLMECLRVLLKDYKNEIEDLLVADKQLQKELIYDMQKYETVKAKTTATEAIATMHRSQSYHTPGAPDTTNEKNKLSKKLHHDSKVASAMADVAAATVVKSVLKEVNKGAATPPLSLLNVPRLTSERAGLSRGHKSAAVIESLRRRQTFDFDEEN